MNTQDWLTIVSMLSALLTGLATSVAYLVWWLSKQFSAIRNLVYERIDKVEDTLLTKLEYHERHDDERFSQISNDLWAIRVRNAARDGEIMDERKKERPRYTSG